MRLRLLRLRATTERGTYERTEAFNDGLTIIRGKNSVGKSTMLMAFLYALGLEGMLTAKHDVPLPHALTEYLEDGIEEVPVSVSDVTIEIENAGGVGLTVQRIIKGEPSRNLVRTWQGRAVSHRADSAPSTDYFVRQQGAAQRDAGFHKLLADFLGWKLPDVARFDGSVGKLYLEAVFPLLFIEQKRGWLGLQARMPTYLGIREPQLRALEFLLRLDIDGARVERARLDADVKRLSDEWRAARQSAVRIAQSVNGEVEGIPAGTGESWPEQGARIRIPEGAGWTYLAGLLQMRQQRLNELMPQPIHTTGEEAERRNVELADAEKRLAALNEFAAQLDEEAELAQAEREAADARTAALRRDLQRNKDAQKLRSLGSLSQLNIVRDRCPTCHQAVTDTLLDQKTFSAMSLKDNIAFIEEMLSTVEAAAYSAARRKESVTSRTLAIGAERQELRTRIRHLRRSLTESDSTPSVAQVEERVRLEQEVERLIARSRRFAEAVAALRRAHDELEAARLDATKLASGDRSNADKKKLKAFERSFIGQVKEYGLRSLGEARLSLDPDTFRPRAEGMPDLEFELSGSDLIRAIWAYYLALLETAREQKTNHPGLLVVDEPKQQGADTESIAGMLRRATESLAAGQQIIVASSESHDALRQAMGDKPYAEVSLDGWVLLRAQGGPKLA